MFPWRKPQTSSGSASRIDEVVLAQQENSSDASWTAVSYQFDDGHQFGLMFRRAAFEGCVMGRAEELLAADQRELTERHLQRSGITELLPLLERIADGSLVSPDDILALQKRAPQHSAGLPMAPQQRAA